MRDFTYDEETLVQGKNERDKLTAEKTRQFAPLVRWLKINFSEIFTAYIHVKALRAFVESVLRLVGVAFFRERKGYDSGAESVRVRAVMGTGTKPNFGDRDFDNLRASRSQNTGWAKINSSFSTTISIQFQDELILAHPVWQIYQRESFSTIDLHLKLRNNLVINILETILRVSTETRDGVPVPVTALLFTHPVLIKYSVQYVWCNSVISLFTFHEIMFISDTVCPSTSKRHCCSRPKTLRNVFDPNWTNFTSIWMAARVARSM